MPPARPASTTCRASPATSAPECRQPLELRVGLAEPRLGAIIAVLAGLWSLAGFGVAKLTIMLTASIAYSDWPPVWYWGPGVFAAVIGPTGALLCSRRRGRAWIRGRSGPVRGLLIAGAWALFATPVVGIAVLLVVMP
jgi:hypothetical protein